MAALMALAVAATTTPKASDLLDAPRPEAADYFALKARIGEAALASLQEQVIAELARRGASMTGAGRCATDAEVEVVAGLLLARRSTSADAFTADRAAARAAFAKADAIWSRLQAGETVEAPYTNVATHLADAKAAKSARLVELHSRVASDQFNRFHFTAAGTKASWATGLSDNAGRYISARIAAEGCRTDHANTEWLKSDLKRHGWPKVTTEGEAADKAAWLLVQHADDDRAFQREVLAVLERLLPEKGTRPASFAYLYDRVAVAEKRPQRFATQGRCTPAKVWEPFDVEDLGSIDKVRASVGLGTLAEYRAGFTCS